VKNSINDPLRIAVVSSANMTGLIGLTLCPGKKDPSRGWCRDLDTDLAAIREWGAEVVVTLVEDHELEFLDVASIAEGVARHDMRWLHLPIRDVSVPDRNFEARWVAAGAELRCVLRRGGSILIHSRGGLGRSGTISARLLVELGMNAQVAIDAVRHARPGAIETLEQERYVRSCRIESASAPTATSAKRSGPTSGAPTKPSSSKLIDPEDCEDETPQRAGETLTVIGAPRPARSERKDPPEKPG